MTDEHPKIVFCGSVFNGQLDAYLPCDGAERDFVPYLRADTLNELVLALNKAREYIVRRSGGGEEDLTKAVNSALDNTRLVLPEFILREAYKEYK